MSGSERDNADDTLAQAVKAVESVLQRWPEQYRRMLRWRARLDEPMQDEERRRDDFYAFFVSAYHLADWIKKDGTVDEHVRGAAWKFRHTGTLGLAEDVVNGFKHLERDRQARRDAAAHVTVAAKLFQLDMAQLDLAQLGTFAIVGDQTREDAYAVADRCIAEWDAFLRDHRLSTS